MRAPGAHDPIDSALADLTPLEPNPASSDAVRHRCRQALVRGAARGQSAVDRSWIRIAVPVLLGFFSALYAVELLSTTLRLR